MFFAFANPVFGADTHFESNEEAGMTSFRCLRLTSSNSCFASHKVDPGSFGIVMAMVELL